MRLTIFLLPATLLLALACGEGGASGPTPTASPQPTATPEAAGETLAFIRNGDVWLVDATGANERSLSLAGVQSFSWVTSDELAVATNDDPSRHLIVDLDGSATELPVPAGGSWSRDGTRYVVVVNEQVVVFNRDGSEAARLDIEPPVETGEKARQCGGTLPDGGQSDRLVFSRPELSPDEQHVLVAVNCVSRAGATGNLYAPVVSVSLTEGTPRQTDLQTNLEDGIGANVAPDGSRLAQAIRFGGSACASDYSVFVADADGGNASELTLPSVAALPEHPRSEEVLGGLIGFDWSPRSDGIVASFNVSVCRHAQEEPFATLVPVLAGLYILKLNGSPEERLLDGPTHSPGWSPSGRYIAYIGQEYFGQDVGPPLLRVFDLTTRDIRDLGEGTQPAWQPAPSTP